MTQTNSNKSTLIKTEVITESLKHSDMSALCDATEAAILDGGGFGWVELPSRSILERFWQGVILVENRELFVGRIDGVIAGTAQLIRQPSNNQAQSFAAKLTTVFVTPWARRKGLATALIKRVEGRAREHKLDYINLDIRTSQEYGIQFFEQMGYIRWGENPAYAKIDDQIVSGYYYHKKISA